jgi:hypothetical protein
MVVGQNPRKAQDNIPHLDGIRKFASGYRHIASLLNYEWKHKSCSDNDQ